MQLTACVCTFRKTPAQTAPPPGQELLSWSVFLDQSRIATVFLKVFNSDFGSVRPSWWSSPDQQNFLSARTLRFYSSFHELTRGDPGAGASVHIWSSTSRTCPTLLFNTGKLESPSSFNRARRAALVQPPPPLLIPRLRDPPHQPSASSPSTLVSSTGCDHSGGDKETSSSSAGYLEATTGSSSVLLVRLVAPHLCFSFLLLSGSQLANVGLPLTAMTGKLAEKLPLTMSSLINSLPDTLYPEEDIPPSMNIFTNSESISHYSQMSAGELRAAGGGQLLPATVARNSRTCLRCELLRFQVDPCTRFSSQSSLQTRARFHIYSTFRCFFSRFCLEDFRPTPRGKVF